ncbi:MAG: TonB-dependent receptor [Flavobacteriales bacterium]
MLARLAYFLTSSLLVLSARGQSCVLVARDDGRSAAGLIVRDRIGATIGTVDDFGRLCPDVRSDTLVFFGKELHTLRIAWDDALRTGRIELRTLRRGTELQPVAVTPSTAHERRALAAVSTVDSMDLSAYEGSSMRSALLWVPGVQMDERGHGGSTRLSIRGSLLRSPYGVRGVKVYWGPFSLTQADGSTTLELLDPALIGSVDVVRSIGGPVYGSAPSGLILAAAPERQDTGFDATLSVIGGSDGYYRLSATTRVRQANGGTLSAGLVHMGNDGYREQESSRRDQVFLTQRYLLKKGSASIYLTAQKAAWGLPGSLDSLTAVFDPRAARPYSQLIDARVEKSQVLAGIAVEQRVWEGLLMRSSLQVQAIDKLNPYGTSPGFSGYKDEQIRSAGTRLSLGRTMRRDKVSFSWEVGLEALLERDQLNERVFVNAEPADPRTDADTRVSNLNGFLSTRLLLGENTTCFADIGTEATALRQQDKLRSLETKDVPPSQFYPMLGIERVLSRQVIAHLRYAESTSRPTIWEVLGSTGVPNTDLAAERVQESEAGMAFDRKGTALTVNGYLRRTRGMILPKRVNNGTEEIFINAGNARQNGVELTARTQHELSGQTRLTALLTGAWQHHRLLPPDNGTAVDVPGVPRWSGGARVRLVTKARDAVELGYRANSSVSANSMNDDRVPGYGVMHFRIEHTWQWKGMRLEAFLLVENVLDVRYTSFIQLNDPGGRYYNPAPGRSYFGGLSFTFDPGISRPIPRGIS